MDVEKTQSVFRRTDLKKKTAKKQIFQKTDKKLIKNGDNFFFKFLKISKNVKTGKNGKKTDFLFYSKVFKQNSKEKIKKAAPY